MSALSRTIRALVVYESMFGNTQQVAEAIAAGLAEHAQATLVEVGSAPTSTGDDLDLLVVGGPTHGRGMSGRETRRDAMDHAVLPVVSQRIGLREWFDSLRSRPDVLAAAFDTRFDESRWLSGSAAHVAATQLRRHGFRLLTAPRSFFVLGMSGPLAAGELERARRWGRMLGVDTTIRLSLTR
ncbi:MAG TPA: flavodoxin domain-containing protein [Actinomycetes bacterium]|nr:flavodoxin domain-containing protein [Actinomycetes bacterium]